MLRRTHDEPNKRQFKITWEDEDGDKVDIDSDKGLAIAIDKQGGPIIKIQVEVLGEKDEKSDEKHRGENDTVPHEKDDKSFLREKDERDDKTHPGVIWDG